jgi:hypothetical protein
MIAELCKACGKPKPSLAVEQGDDFCSTECARGHYGSPRSRLARAVVATRQSFRRQCWRRPSGFPKVRKI